MIMNFKLYSLKSIGANAGIGFTIRTIPTIQSVPIVLWSAIYLVYASQFRRYFGNVRICTDYQSGMSETFMFLRQFIFVDKPTVIFSLLYLSIFCFSTFYITLRYKNYLISSFQMSIFHTDF